MAMFASNSLFQIVATTRNLRKLPQAYVSRRPASRFHFGNQVLISSHRKLLSSKAMVVNVAEKSEQDFGRHN
jgi:hypothetical protein